MDQALKRRIMEIKDPREAYKTIALEESLSMDERMDLVDQYAETHKIDPLEMAYYPDGTRVMDEV